MAMLPIPPVEEWRTMGEQCMVISKDVKFVFSCFPCLRNKLDGKEVWLDGKEVWLDGKEVWLDGKEVWLDGKEVWSDGKEVWLDGKEVWSDGLLSSMSRVTHPIR
eukprot:Em0002g1672a